MSRKQRRVFATIVALSIMTGLFASTSFGAATGGWIAIEKFKSAPGGVIVQLEGFTSPDSSVVCPAGAPDRGGAFYLREGSANYDARFATLLAAFLNHHRINIAYYACDSDGYLTPSSISVHPEN